MKNYDGLTKTEYYSEKIDPITSEPVRCSYGQKDIKVAPRSRKSLLFTPEEIKERIDFLVFRKELGQEKIGDDKLLAKLNKQLLNIK